MIDQGADACHAPLEDVDPMHLAEGVANDVIDKTLFYGADELSEAVYVYPAMASISVQGTSETFQAPLVIEPPEG